MQRPAAEVEPARDARATSRADQASRQGRPARRPPRHATAQAPRPPRAASPRPAICPTPVAALPRSTPGAARFVPGATPVPGLPGAAPATRRGRNRDPGRRARRGASLPTGAQLSEGTSRLRSTPIFSISSSTTSPSER